MQRLTLASTTATLRTPQRSQSARPAARASTGACALRCSRRSLVQPLASAAPQREQPDCSPASSPAASPRGSSPDAVGSKAGPLAGTLAAAALLLPLAAPEAAEAAGSASTAAVGSLLSAMHGVQHQLTCNRGYWLCVGLGSGSVLTTLFFTSRFLMSYFPELEKRAKQRPSAFVLRALTVADPILDPITKGVFRMTERGDLNYGAMALLAFSSAITASLLGDGGLMVDAIPDLGLLQALRYLNFFQHMLLLPMWVFVVFRFFLLL